MLEEEFETRPTDPLSNAIFIIVDIYIINLGYLENRPLHFMELLDSGTKEFNKILVGLNIATVIPETND